MAIEYTVLKNQYDKEMKQPTIGLHETEFLDLRAKFAMDLIARWGMIAGEPDGEDSAGRQRGKLADEVDLVNRAMLITTLAFKQFNDNEWITHLPSLETMKKMVENKELEKA